MTEGMNNGSARQPESAPRPLRRVRTLRELLGAVLIFYCVLIAFGARGLYNWATHLPVSRLTAICVTVTDALWAKTAAVGLEVPGLVLETRWLAAQEASPLLNPKTYDEMDAHRARRTQLAAKGATTVRHKYVPQLWKLKKNVPRRRAPDGGPSVLVLGDSIMTSIGPVIKTDIVARLSGDAQVIAKIATGLARPDVFDWRSELRRDVETWHYDYTVLMLGTNDSQDFIDQGQILSYGTEEWVRAYNERIAEMMDYACHGSDHAFWIGLPPMKTEAFQRKVVRINSWARNQAERHPCVTYVSLDNVIGDERGEFTSYLKISNSVEKVRMVDGIHITPKGGKLVAKALVGFIRKSGALAH